MDLRQWILEGFTYDAWANRRWADRLGSFNDPERANRATEILMHILDAQRIWLTRCGAMVEFDKRDEHLGAFAESSAQAWRMFIEMSSLEETIDYRTMAGDPYSNTIGEIALHVINHGTYHRGHLRGLAELEGLKDFQDTDLILYWREQKG
jgi:uncharacterized damage-inducible protein DinB